MVDEVLLLREPDIRRLLDPRVCLSAIEAAFAAYSTGRADLPAVIQLNVPERQGEIHVKAGHLHGGPVFAVKIASGFPGNPALGRPASGGLVIAFDAATGAPAALLLDNGYITDLRTGLAGAVAARHLSRKDASIAAVIGSGAQARHQARALLLVRDLREVRVFGRDAGRAAACVAELAADAAFAGRCRVTRAETAEAAARGADIVITATSSRTPVLRDAWIGPGVHVTAVGSDQADKQELEPELVARADRLVADSRAQCLRIGEIHHAIAAGLIGADAIDAELGELAAGLAPGRRTDDEITLADLTGVGVQDVAAAGVVLARARADGAGERIAL
ncbi:MAG TPA: ornithine cyclodeaminase family protein [Patescibacteria group bacterium]|nr:ornithine cyclodeaminase family protein [Patescibacteria group bacterium]